jgi:tRNA (mo5U34)-methyltransferase
MASLLGKEALVVDREWLRSQIEAEPSWFLNQDLGGGLVTPGWSDPANEKLPYFGLPEDMSGMRVLDIGCNEGFFSFEAERRGAESVIGIDSSPVVVQHFHLCRMAMGMKADAYLTNVYDITQRTFGTFDLVMFFGVLYHLRHPLLALEKVFEVASGTLLMQSASFENPALGDESAAEFHPFGIESGPAEKREWDHTVFWVPNSGCIRDMLLHVGFVNVECLNQNAGAVFRAEAPIRGKGLAPDQKNAPWS